jgi:hypothetical protein
MTTSRILRLWKNPKTHWKWKKSISKIQNTGKESIINTLDQAVERISGIEDKIEEMQHSDKGKKISMDTTF